MDANTHPCVVLSIFEDLLRTQVKEIYGFPTSMDSVAYVEFESEEDAADAVLKYSNKPFGWNEQKVRLELILPQDMEQCNHDDVWATSKEHDRECRLSIFLREKDQRALKSDTVLISGLNQHHELVHLQAMLGEKRTKGRGVNIYDDELAEPEDIWDAICTPDGSRGTALIRFHDGCAPDYIEEWNGKYFKNNTIYLKCVPDAEYDAIVPKKHDKQANKQLNQEANQRINPNPQGKLHMGNLPQGADVDFVRRVLYRYKIDDKTFFMGKNAVVYLNATDLQDILTRFPNGIRFEGRKISLSEWVGKGKKGNNTNRGPSPRPVPTGRSNNSAADLSTRVGNLNLGSRSTNWRSRTPSRNREPSGNLVVRNLDYKATEQDVRQLFSGFTVLRLTMKKGFAFVDVAGQDEVERAIRELNEKHVHARKVSIEVARSKN